MEEASSISNVPENCPPSCLAFDRMEACIKGDRSSLFLRGVSKSVSPVEKRQFFNFPSAVRRIRLQELQNGALMVLIMAKEPSCPGIIKCFAVSCNSFATGRNSNWVPISENISLMEKTLVPVHLFPLKGINSIKRI